MNRHCIELSYLGKNYKGWQVQENATTVQGTVEFWLSKILNKKIEITGSSRTDTGVHAAQQFAHFDTDRSFDTESLLHAMNSTLPADISIKKIFAVEKNFHARYAAIARTYVYTITQQKNPFIADESFFLQKIWI